MKKLVKTIIEVLKNRTENIYMRPSFSVNGEDILINSILDGIKKGFYVDVGAHHPFRFSNTYLLYKKGWNGINIDANEDSIKLLTKFRQKDINILAAVAETDKILTFYSNPLGAMNTFDKSKYDNDPDKFPYKKEVKTTTLRKLILKHVPANTSIDFMNVDIEGFDLKALKSFPWEIYHPKLVCVEDLNFKPNEPNTSDIHNFLLDQGYCLKSFIPNTLFYI